MKGDDIIKTTAHRILKAHGFRRRSAHWYRQTEECLLVFNLQHSQWSPLYYINLAVEPLAGRSPDTPEYPKQYQCRLGMRLPDLGLDEDSVLDLEIPMEEAEREARLVRILEEHCVPLLEQMGSIDGLRKLFPKALCLQHLPEKPAETKMN